MTKEEYMEKFNQIDEKVRELQFQVRYKDNEVGLYKDLLEQKTSQLMRQSMYL